MNKFLYIPKLQISIFLAFIFLNSAIHYQSILYIQTFFIALVSTIVFDLVFLKLRRIKLFFPSAAIVTGSIIGLVTSPNLFWYQLVTIGGLAMFSKNYLRFGGQHVFNPAAFGILFSHFVFSQNVSWWAVSWQQLGIQNSQSVIYFLMLLMPGLVSVIRMRRFITILAFYMVYIFFTKTIFDPTVIFFSLVMLPEPMTTPFNRTKQFLFGICVAVFSFLIRFSLPDILISALLLGNIVFFLVLKYHFSYRKGLRI